MLLTLLLACTANEGDKDDSGGATSTCQNPMSFPFLGWNLTFTTCLPTGWEAQVESSRDLVDGVYLLKGVVTNFPMREFEASADLLDGQLVVDIAAWELHRYTPPLFGSAITLEEGMKSAQATLESNGATVSDLVATDVDGLAAWYFVQVIAERESDVFPGLTSVSLFVELDAEEERVLYYAGRQGGSAAASADPNAWEGDLGAKYWPMVQATTLTTVDE